MTERESVDDRRHRAFYTEPPDGDEGVRPARKGRQAFRKLRRELSEEELSNPGTLRMILDQHDELVQENDELRRIRERFHVRDKEAAVLR